MPIGIVGSAGKRVGSYPVLVEKHQARRGRLETHERLSQKGNSSDLLGVLAAIFMFSITNDRGCQLEDGHTRWISIDG